MRYRIITWTAFLGGIVIGFVWGMLFAANSTRTNMDRNARQMMQEYQAASVVKAMADVYFNMASNRLKTNVESIPTP